VATKFFVTIEDSGGDYVSLNQGEADLESNILDATTANGVFSVSAVANDGPVEGTVAGVEGLTSGAIGTLIKLNFAEDQCYITEIGATAFVAEVVKDIATPSKTMTLSNTRDGMIPSFQCGAIEDTSIVAFDGWDTDATNYIDVFVPLANRHSGVFSITKYRMTGTNLSDMFDVSEYLHVEGIQIHATELGRGGEWADTEFHNHRA